MPTSLLILISAPSGAGKTTLGDGLLRQNPRLRRVITCTTRAPRAGERDGVDYHFLSAEDFSAKVAGGEFLEHANVYGRCYGTLAQSVRSLLNEGWDALLTIDVQGADSVRRLASTDETIRQALVTIFLSPSSESELLRRLEGRGTEPPEIRVARFSAAMREVAHWREFDYLIVSGTREEDLKRAQAIVDSESLRTPRNSFKWEL